MFLWDIIYREEEEAHSIYVPNKNKYNMLGWRPWKTRIPNALSVSACQPLFSKDIIY